MNTINRKEFFRGTFILIVVSLILMVFGIGNTLADWVIEPTKAGFVPVKGGRIWYRMNGNEHFAKGKTPLEVEMRLVRMTPDEFKKDAHHWLILHGRYVCKARKPMCGECPIVEWCEFTKKELP